jgi:hypothetical protein
VPKLGLQSSPRKKPSEIDYIEQVSPEKAIEQVSPEKVATPAPEALKESIDYIIRHASRKVLSMEEKREAQHYAQKLKYPKGHWCSMAAGRKIFCTVSRITKKYPSAGR